MATMYETIMNLPLFKGVSNEQVSAFLEKTHLKFTKYSAGETIASRNEPVKGIKCIISGDASAKYNFADGSNLFLTETISGGHIIGADRLFGMDTTYNSDVTALNQVSVMEFNKEQYLNLLNSAPIYLLNYLNYLSYRAQKNSDITIYCPMGELGSILKCLIEIFTSRRAKAISFEYDLPTLSKFTNLSESKIVEELELLSKKGAIEKNSEGLRVIDKELL